MFASLVPEFIAVTPHALPSVSAIYRLFLYEVSKSLVKTARHMQKQKKKGAFPFFLLLLLSLVKTSL